MIPKFGEILKSSKSTNHSNLLRSHYIEPLEKLYRDSAGIVNMVETFLDLESVVEKGEYLIRADFDDNFQRLSQEKQKIEDSLKKYVYQVFINI